jgi:hypothetical protein
MASEHTTAYIDATAGALGLTVAPEWKENVATFLDIARGMAALVEEARAETAVEAAPVFTPRAVE